MDSQRDNASSDDLSALSWVQEELRKSLEGAHKSLRRFLKESQSAAGSDVDDVEPAVLRTARQQIHQGVGALELVGLTEGATLLRASEAALQRFVAKPQNLDTPSVDKIEHASFALLDYIGRRLLGKPVSALSLFPQMRAVLELAGAERIHPADLWAHDWRWRDVPAATGTAPTPATPELLSDFETRLLSLMRTSGTAQADVLRDHSLGLAAAAANARSATLWRLAAGFFEAWGHGLLPADVFVKRMASRVLGQLRAQVKGDADAPERLAHDLLFYCARSVPAADQPAPSLLAVRSAFELGSQALPEYNESRLGRFDPAVLAQARKRVGAAKEAWSAVAGGEMHRLMSLNEQFALIGDSLKRLFPMGEWLAESFGKAVAQVVQSGAAPSAPLAMEVATGLLYVEATIEDGEFDDPTQGLRVQRLADRVDAVRRGEAAEPLEPWMEELYRRVSDRQTMGSVVQELRASLSEVERQMDLFFRNPSDRTVLIPVPGQLASMRGVLSVLGMDQASHAAVRMRDDVDALVSTEVDPQRAFEAGTFERIAGNLGALGFLIDLLSVQPQVAKSLFRFDADTGVLSPVMGRSTSPAPLGPIEATMPLGLDLIDRARDVASAAQSDRVPLSDVTIQLQELSKQVLVSDQPSLAASVSSARAAIEQAHQAGAGQATEQAARDQVAQAMADFVATATGPIGLDSAHAPLHDAAGSQAAPRSGARPSVLAPLTPAAAPVEATGLEDDDEMRGIFLEEAREVMESAAAALAALASAPDDVGQMTSVRRSFHTLKGSSRMVGLKDFGEAGWACEQLYNAWLADQQPASEDLLAFTADALRYLGEWIEQIAGRAAVRFTSEPVALAADTLRLEGRRIEIAWPTGAAAPAVVAPPAVASRPAALDAARSIPAAFVDAPAAEPAPPPMTLDFSADAMSLIAAMPSGPASMPSSLPGQSLKAEQEDDGEGSTSPMPLGEPEPAPSFDEVIGTIDLDLPMPAPQPTIDVLSAGQAAAPAHASVPTPAPGPAAPVPDFELPDLPVPEIVAEELPPGAADAFHFDLPAVEFPAEQQPAPEAATGRNAEAFLQPFEFARQPVEPSEPLQAEPQPAEPVAHAPTPTPTPTTAPAHEPVPVPVPDAPAVAAAPAAPVVPELPVAEVEAEEAFAAEQVKVVGPLRISIPLFNIYLSEADELSRRLSTELAEWAMELHRPVGETAVALAHSLAGSSATVGFADLSHLARQLEHSLDRANQLGEASPQEASLFVDAAEEVRRLLHQFAAGFLKEPEPEIVQRLAAYELDSAARVQAQALQSDRQPLSSEPEPSPVRPFRSSSHQGLRAAESGFGDRDDDEDRPTTVHGDLGVAELRPLSPLEVHSTHHARAPDVPDLGDDEIDAVDAVDADLFPIFEEEALELLPLLASQMREWTRRPGERSAATACMRTLHTFKGGARLAGAMRLGEMAHRLETSIDQLLARDEIDAEHVDPLQARVDAIDQAFDLLRARDAQAYEKAQQAAAAQPAALAPVSAPASVPASVPAPVPASAPAAAPVLPDLPTLEPETWLLQSLPLVDMSVPLASETRFDPAAAEATQASELEPIAAALPGGGIDWSRFTSGGVAEAPTGSERAAAGGHAVRVRTQLLDRLVNQAGEVSITRARLQSEVGLIKGSLSDLTDNLERLRQQLRDIELQAETQMTSRLEAARLAAASFDPLEFDRFTRFQELTRMMAESVNDVATVQRTLQRTLETAEDELAAQARLTRELQSDLLRTRMVEFDSLSERLYRVVRQAAKESGKQVRLDIVGASIEVDRGVLERMTGSFEHLLRNCVVHGIEPAQARTAAGKDAAGTIVVNVEQEGNEVSVEVRDDGGGLNLPRIRARGVHLGLVPADANVSDAELANLIFTSGFSTADSVTELAGRGVGMDVVRSEVNAMGGRIETATAVGKGTSFKLRLPLTTAVTQVVMVRCGEATVAIPSNLVEIVRRSRSDELEAFYQSGTYALGDQLLPFFWMGALLQLSGRSVDSSRTVPIVIIRSAQQRIALHVDEVLGNQEVVVKNLGPQLSRVPGLAGMTLLASGAVALIYNPVALATVYGAAARAQMVAPVVKVAEAATPAVPSQPLVLVVDDSLTVRRVTQRMLAREGYRVALAKDGLEAIEMLSEELPAVVLSDIEMPRMDGFDLLRNIRGDARTHGLPVIMITSRIAQKHRDFAAELGANHYLGKPYSEEELLSLVRRYTSPANSLSAGPATIH